MAVLTRCEAEWRFYSSPFVSASGETCPNKFTPALKNAADTHKVIEARFSPLDHFIAQVKNMTGVEPRPMSLGSVFTPGG